MKIDQPGLETLSNRPYWPFRCDCIFYDINYCIKAIVKARLTGREVCLVREERGETQKERGRDYERERETHKEREEREREREKEIERERERERERKK